MGELNLSRASLTSYLPHRKRVYFPNDSDIEQISLVGRTNPENEKRQRLVERL